MDPHNFRRSASLIRLVSILILATLSFVSAMAQAKPERPSKVTKAPQPQSASSGQDAPASPNSSDSAKEESKPEDKVFKGMKYRLIGPFRGGRSLTAAGIPGDPTTYYFGATGGGVWKSTDAAMTWSPVFDKEGT